MLFVGENRFFFYDTKSGEGWLIPRSFPYLVAKVKLDVRKALQVEMPAPIQQLLSPKTAMKRLFSSKDGFGTYYIHPDLTEYVEEQLGLRLYYPFPFQMPENTQFIPYGVGVLGLHRQGNLVSLIYADPLGYRYIRGITIEDDIAEGVRFLLKQLNSIFLQVKGYAEKPDALKRQVRGK